MKGLDDLKASGREEIISAIGAGIWELFDPFTQTGVLTAEYCLRAFWENPEGVDFSASIVPVMRALENELARNFYTPYMSYLKSHYPDPEDYVRANALRSGRGRPYPQEKRKKVIGYDKEERCYFYINVRHDRAHPVRFSIGDFRYTAGVDDLFPRKCDKTAAAFYKYRFFGDGAGDRRVTDWICGLARELEGLRQLRNRSSHAGIIQTREEASDAMDIIIRTGRVLETVSNPSLT